MLVDTPDPIIAASCSRNGHVLISHDGDFRRNAKQLQITQKQYQNSLHRIILKCDEPNDIERLTEALPLIEAEWSALKEGRPMVIEIRSLSIVTIR